jgi:hypothetical protein
MADVTALEQLLDDFDSLGQHLTPLRGGRPAPPNDVLIECFARSHS